MFSWSHSIKGVGMRHDPKAWLEFLQAGTSAESIEGLRKWIGGCIRRENKQALWLHGGYCTGKSVICRVIAAVVRGAVESRAPVCYASKNDLERPLPVWGSVADNDSALLVVDGAPPEILAGKVAASMACVLGGEAMTISRMYKPDTQQVVRCSLALVSNHPPAIEEGGAVARRLLVVGLKRVGPIRHKVLEELVAERDQILRWAEAGALAGAGA